MGVTINSKIFTVYQNKIFEYFFLIFLCYRELESQLPKIEKEIQEAYEEKRNLEKLRNDIKRK